MIQVVAAVTEDPLDIRDLAEQLCERAGVEYNATTEIVIHPNDLRIDYVVLGRNKRGHFYMDETSGDAVSRTLTRAVLT